MNIMKTIKSEYVSTSRYGDNRVLKKINDTQYTLSGRSLYHRMGWDDKNSGYEFIDFEGGPFVHMNDTISFYGASDDDRRISKIEIVDTGDSMIVTALLTVTKQEE